MYCKKYIAIFNEGTTDIDILLISLQVFMVSLLFKKNNRNATVIILAYSHKSFLLVDIKLYYETRL